MKEPKQSSVGFLVWVITFLLLLFLPARQIKNVQIALMKRDKLLEENMEEIKKLSLMNSDALVEIMRREQARGGKAK